MAKSNFIVRGGADFSGLYKGFNTAQKRITSFQATINKTFKGIGITLSGIAIGKLIKDSTSMAMGVESAMDNISRNMGNSAEAFNQWVRSQSKALGMAKADAYEYGSTFSNLLASFSSNAQETADNTQKLMKAAAIIASKTGRTYEDTANRIRSGLLGSTEAIEDLGVYVNVSMLESTEAFRKFAGNKSWNQLSYQTQQQIRLAAILEQTYKRYGDILADTTQTRQAQFVASLKNIQLTLGQAFLPIYNAVLPALTAMADAIGRVVSMFAQFTQTLFGKPMAAQTKATQQQATAMTELGEATEEAAKKANKNIQAFDEVHQLQEDISDTAAGNVTAIQDTGAIAPIETEDLGEPEALTKMQKVLEKLKVLFEPAIDGFNRLKETAEPVITNVGDGLKWFLDEVLVPFGTWTISEAIPAFLNLLSGALAVLNPLLETFAPLGQWLWESFLQPIASWTGGIIVDILGWLSEKLVAIGDWIKEHSGIIQTFTIIVGSFAAAWLLVTNALKAWNIVVGIWNALGPIATGVTTILSSAIAFITSPIGIAIAAIGAFIAIIINLWRTNEEFRNKVSELWERIKEIFSLAFEAIKGFIMDFYEELKAWWEPRKETIIQVIQVLWDTISGIITAALDIIIGLLDIFIGIFTGNWEKFKQGIEELWIGMWNAIKTVLEGAWDLLKIAFNSLWNSISGWFNDLIKSAYNWGKNLIQNFIDGIKSMINKVKDAVSKVAEKVKDFLGFSSPTKEGPGSKADEWMPNMIQMLADGIYDNIGKIKSAVRYAAYNLSTLSDIQYTLNLDNNFDSQELPIADLTDIITSAVGTAIMVSNQFNTTNDDNKPIILQIDGTAFARIIGPYIDKENQRIGSVIIQPI